MKRVIRFALVKSAFAFPYLVFVVGPSPAYQPPIRQVELGSADKLTLTPAEEKDSYEIYSMLLRTEMPSEWKITAWAIRQETQTFPAFGAMAGSDVSQCLSFVPDQKSIYLPLIQDYVARNKKKLVLERKFDLPQYALIEASVHDIGQSALPFKPTVVFHVSALGFNQDRTRALVYIGHHNVEAYVVVGGIISW